MGHTLQPPSRLDDQRYFVLRHDRELDVFELVTPSDASSYRLGDSYRTRQYFWSIGMETLGDRALDAARSFGIAMAIVKEGRAFGLDLTKREGGSPATQRAERELNMQRALGDEWADDNDDGMLL